jgi:hypothetical protein
MGTLERRIERIEESPGVQSAARIAYANSTGDLSRLTDAELLTRIEDMKREILAHPEEWRASCDALAGRIGERVAALREMRLKDLTDAELEWFLAEIGKMKTARDSESRAKKGR